MAERDDRERTNDPVTAPPAEAGAPRPGPTTDRPPRRNDAAAPHMDREEAASRAQAQRSGRTAAKLFGVGLVLLLVVVLLGSFFTGDGRDEPAAAGEVEADAD